MEGKMKSYLRFLLLSSLLLMINLNILNAQVESSAGSGVKSLLWKVKYTEWSQMHEKLFQEFVQNLGEAREKGFCKTTAQCLSSKDANKLFYNKNPQTLKPVFADCADLPHILRGYFAWMNDLPFSYPSSVTPASTEDSSKNIRYTKNGNKITGIRMIKTGENVNDVLAAVSDTISTAMFRVHPKMNPEGKIFSDNYSLKVNRNAIVPGSIIYDPAGHIAVVYKVEDDGRVKFIDAHPDNSLTKSTYGEKFVRSRPAAGAGFKGWRSVKLVNATQDANGNYVGGYLTAKNNEEMVHFGVEQYYGNQASSEINDTNWSKGKFVINGETINYYDYIRRSLSSGNLKYRPEIELTNMLQSLCYELKDRMDAVNTAFKNGMNAKKHPERLPDNIYGTDGEWESFSTPSRDARFKASVREISKRIKEFVSKYNNNDPMIVYSGNNLVSDLLTVYEKESSACGVVYSNSTGEKITLTLDDVISRLFLLSFDPYHCVELRWGATGSELATCKDSADKVSWYKGEQALRNMIDRDYDLKMSKSLSELLAAPFGVKDMPEINPKKVLENL